MTVASRKWEYYDLAKQEVFSGWEGSVTSVEFWPSRRVKL